MTVEAASVPSPVTSPARRILVADDSVDVAESIGMLLRMWGHEVRLAHTGRETIEASGSYRPDIVLLDIGLPDMSGYEVARLLRQESGTGSPVLIAVTGFGQDEATVRAGEAGIDLHLIKPVDPEKLRVLLASLGGEESSPVRARSTQ